VSSAYRNRIGVALFVALLVILPLVPATPEFWITLLNYIGLSSLVVLGLVLLTGVGGLTSFGQAAFVGMGAYVTGYLTTAQGLSPWLTLPIGLVVTGLIAYAIGAITLRLSGHYLPLGTIAWGISLFFLFGNMDWLGKYDGLNGLPALQIFGVSLERGRDIFYLIWLFVLLAVMATSNLLDSRPGRAIRALRGGVAMAESFGVDTARYKIIVFIYAALFACVSGWLYAHLQRSINPTPFGINAGIEYLFMAVVGGAAHVWGAILGAALVTVAKDQLQDLLPRLLGSNGNFETIVFGVLLVLLLQHAQDGMWPFVLRWFRGMRSHKAARRAGAAVVALPSRQRATAGERVLEVELIRKEFGGLVAVNDISFSLGAGEIVGLIGPNGAGKSTTFNLITGVLPATRGEVRFCGERIDGKPARAIVRLGMARTFQHVQLLTGMSVLENVALGAHLRSSVGILGAALRLDRPEEARILDEAWRQLERVGLSKYADELAGNLALGQQRILEIARALAADPKLLLLDEPAAGLRYKEKQDLAEVLRQLRAEGMSILLVEHDMEFVMGLTDHLVVMDFGTKLAEGRPEAIRANPLVLEAYLGGVEPATATEGTDG
jgi:branched-chain amino acid transport system permease protein